MANLLRIIGIILIVVSSLLLSCSPKATETQVNTSPAAIQTIEPKEGEVFYKEHRVNKVILGSSDWTAGSYEVSREPLILIDNSCAKNVSYSNLMVILAETRPQRDSINSFDSHQRPMSGLRTCGYYVEQLHDSAEEQGIMAGIVILEATETHAINVFNTTDKGIVYIDASYYEDKIIPSLTIGQSYEVFGNWIVILDYQIIWEGYHN